jgi:hypothetical protein
MTSSWSSNALVGLTLVIASGCGASAPASGVTAMGSPAVTPLEFHRFTPLSPDVLDEVLTSLAPLVHADMLRLAIGQLSPSTHLVDAQGTTPLFEELLTLEETLRKTGATAAEANFDALRARSQAIPADSQYASPHARHARHLALLQLEALAWHAAIDIAFELGGPLVTEPFLRQLPAQFSRFGRAFFDALVPADSEYATLRDTHVALEGLVIALNGAETQLPVDANWYPTLFGTKKPRILLLRQRLAEVGLFAPPVTEMRSFDSSMERQLKAFQVRHSLEVTGRPNADTAYALNIPLKARVAEVGDALRQRRLDPLRSVPDRLVLNIPSFELHRFLAGARVSIYSVVVGSNETDIDPFRDQRGPINRTPSMVTSVTQIVLNPSWTVPRRIKELVLDPLADHDPRRYDDFRLVVGPDGVEQAMQLPGPNNALGQVKFVLSGTPIVMHATPGRRPFKLRQRALSHGDVRIQHAAQLAKSLLVNDGHDITPKRVEGVFKTRNETFVTLQTPVPMSIYYATVDVGRDGEVRFHPDVYNVYTQGAGQGRGAAVARTQAP